MGKSVVRSAKSIENEIQRMSVHLFDPGPPVPTYERVRQWSHFAREYLAASEHLRSRDVPLFLPWIQLSGHAVECSIKSYLCAVGNSVPKEHDLVKLLDLALSAGLSVEERDVAMLVYLNHQYSRDLRSKTRYKARYPTESWEAYGGTIPDLEFLRRIVQDFCGQAAAANERLNRNDLDTGLVESSP